MTTYKHGYFDAFIVDEKLSQKIKEIYSQLEIFFQRKKKKCTVFMYSMRMNDSPGTGVIQIVVQFTSTTGGIREEEIVIQIEDILKKCLQFYHLGEFICIERTDRFLPYLIQSTMGRHGVRYDN